MSQHPVAFMSYVRFDDEHENGRLTEFCKRLSGEVRMQTGERFHIFQDRNDIAWGQQWKHCLENSLDVVTFLIPIITPGFFKSLACRGELERFLEREKALGRDDLILPVYYVNCQILNNEAKREADPLAKVVASRQHTDWRELRFERFTSPQAGKMLAKMATQIVEAVERGRPAQPSIPVSLEASSQQASQSAFPVDLTSEDAEQTSALASRLAHKTEPPTRIVDAFHRGDHPSLGDALKVAQPGDRILLRPGLYREGMVIDKPVEVIGDGELGEVVIEATGENAVLFRASMGRIANLTLRQAGGGNWCCVDIAQGRLDVEECDISSRSSACVGIHGGADPRLRRNRIHDGEQSGVFVYDNGQGTLEDNEIFRNAYPGVEIMTGGSPTLRHNRIYDGQTPGVFVHDNGEGTLEDNDIFGNALSGVEIKTGGNPILRRNRIHNGKTDGVFVRDNGEATLEDNDIFGNTLSGVEIKTGGNPILRRNRIHDGKENGVFVHDGGQGTLDNNDIFGNILSGVEITTGGNPILCRNRIHDGKQNGVLVWEDGQGTLEGNDIFANAYAGVEIRAGGNPTLRRNRIESNTYQAIWVHEGGQGVFEENDLRGNAGGAWHVSQDSLDKVTRTRNQE
jgi:parallel beta-helix repeat protein